MIMVIPGNSRYMTGSLRDYSPQKTLVLYDYSLCLTGIQYRSIKQMLTHAFTCVKHNLIHCIFESAVTYSEGLSKDVFIPLRYSSYCGSIWMQEKPMSHIEEYILIVVPTTYNIHINILEFYFFLSNPLHCHLHGISFSHSVIKTEAYCGVRVPWNFITRGNTIMLHLVIREFNVYSLQLFYSSFDSSWLSDVSTVLKMYKDDFGSFDVAKPYSPENTLVYE